MSMRQRILGVGGEFDMRSGEGGGTTIVVRVPLEQDTRGENTPERETQTAE